MGQYRQHLEIDGWTTFDLGVRYVFAAGETPVTLRLTIDNIGNTRYWASAFEHFRPPCCRGSRAR